MDIVENAKSIYELIKKLNQQDLLEKMADLRDQILNLREENHQLKEKLLEKENKNIIFEKGAYFELKQDGTKEGPFCSVCWDKDKKLIRLKETRVGWYDSINNIDDTHQVEICPICKTRRS